MSLTLAVIEEYIKRGGHYYIDADSVPVPGGILHVRFYYCPCYAKDLIFETEIYKEWAKRIPVLYKDYKAFRRDNKNDVPLSPEAYKNCLFKRIESEHAQRYLEVIKLYSGSTRPFDPQVIPYIRSIT